MGPMANGLLIHTGIIAAGREVPRSVATSAVNRVWSPMVGVKAMKMPMAAPKPIWCGAEC